MAQNVDPIHGSNNSNNAMKEAEGQTSATKHQSTSKRFVSLLTFLLLLYFKNAILALCVLQMFSV